MLNGINEKKGFTLIEVLIACSIVVVFITTSCILINEITLINEKSKEYYQSSKIAQSIVEELKCINIAPSIEDHVAFNEYLKNYTSTYNGGYHIEIYSELLLVNSSLYLVRVDITNKSSDTSYILYTCINVSGSNSQYYNTYDELKINDWEI